MSTHAAGQGNSEWFFPAYGARLRHPELPLIALRQIFERGGDTGAWRHEDFYALYLVQGGRGIHVINNHPYAIARGDVYITPPGTTHAYRDYHALRALAFCFQTPLFADDELQALRALPGFWHLFVQPETTSQAIASDNAAFQNIASQAATSSANSRNAERKATSDVRALRADYHLHLSPERLREAEAMAMLVETELQEAEQPISKASSKPSLLRVETRPLVRGLFFRLLVSLARWQATSGIATSAVEAGRTPQSGALHLSQRSSAHELASNRERATDGGLADVVRFCEEHFAQPLSVPQLAARMFLSPGRFSLVFSRQMGMPPAAYIRRLRLERAQHLLRHSSLSTSQIAQQCGFHDGAQLARLFRAAFGQTPSTYRNDYGRGA